MSTLHGEVRWPGRSSLRVGRWPMLAGPPAHGGERQAEGEQQRPQRDHPACRNAEPVFDAEGRPSLLRWHVRTRGERGSLPGTQEHSEQKHPRRHRDQDPRCGLHDPCMPRSERAIGASGRTRRRGQEFNNLRLKALLLGKEAETPNDSALRLFLHQVYGESAISPCDLYDVRSPRPHLLPPEFGEEVLALGVLAETNDQGPRRVVHQDEPVEVRGIGRIDRTAACLSEDGDPEQQRQRQRHIPAPPESVAEASDGGHSSSVPHCTPICSSPTRGLLATALADCLRSSSGATAGGGRTVASPVALPDPVQCKHHGLENEHGARHYERDERQRHEGTSNPSWIRGRPSCSSVQYQASVERPPMLGGDPLCQVRRPSAYVAGKGRRRKRCQQECPGDEQSIRERLLIGREHLPHRAAPGRRDSTDSNASACPATHRRPSAASPGVTRQAGRRRRRSGHPFRSSEYPSLPASVVFGFGDGRLMVLGVGVELVKRARRRRCHRHHRSGAAAVASVASAARERL